MVRNDIEFRAIYREALNDRLRYNEYSRGLTIASGRTGNTARVRRQVRTLLLRITLDLSKVLLRCSLYLARRAEAL